MFQCKYKASGGGRYREILQTLNSKESKELPVGIGPLSGGNDGGSKEGALSFLLAMAHKLNGAYLRAMMEAPNEELPICIGSLSAGNDGSSK